MAEEENQNISTALAIVEKQQNIVGSAIVGASGTTLLAEKTDGQSQILEQLRDLQVRAVRGIRDVANRLGEMLTFDRDQARKEKEQRAELAKESDTTEMVGPDIDTGQEEQQVEEGKGKLQMIGQFFAGLPGVGFISKLFKPILAFFGKGGMLVKLFGRFGPLGAFILAATLIYKYADEIAKALAPAVDTIKAIIVKLQPVIDVIMKIADFLIKGIIKGIGEALSFVFGTVEKFIDGFKKLFSGDILGGISDIFEGIVRAVFAIPLMIVNFLKPLFMDLVNLIAEPWNKMVNAVHKYIANIFSSITNFFGGLFDSISDFITGIPEKIMGFVKNMFSPIIDFFAGIGDRIKTVVNGIIDSLPLPKFIKDKMKFETKATKAADEVITETGIKAKYVDDTMTGMKRERVSAGGATMQEGFDEAQGEKYGTAEITKSGTGHYEYEKGIMTPKEFEEYRKLDTEGQLAFLKSLDEEEQKRREMIMNLRDKKIAFDKQNADYIKKYKVDEPEFMGPDDQMLQDYFNEKILRQPKTKMEDVGPVEPATAPVTQIVNSSPVNSQTNVASSTTHAGKLDTGIDPYHDRHAYVA